MRVFISYSTVDGTVAQKVTRVFESLGVDYFLDRKDVSWGDDVAERIRHDLAECSDLVVIISPASLKSQWVSFEIGQAAALHKNILPFLTHPSLELPSYISKYHYKSKIKDIRNHFQEILGGDSRPDEHLGTTAKNALEHFLDAWDRHGMSNPLAVVRELQEENRNILKITAEIYGRNLLVGDLDKTKHVPKIAWTQEESSGICMGQLMTGYLLDRFLRTGAFSIEAFPKKMPKGFQNAPELLSRWFEGVMSSDWINIWGDQLSVELANHLGTRILFDGMPGVANTIKRYTGAMATMRVCVLLGIVLHRFLMSGAPDMRRKDA